MKQHIHIIKMGGTIEFIDPSYDAINRQLIKGNASVEDFLANIIQPHFSYSIEEVAQKDSREINDSDRNNLLRAIKESPHDNILITHGTFTMKDTAKFLKSAPPLGKRVIVTGSMIPIVGFSASDAGFNLGFSIASFNNVEPGVYISMNGGIFDYDKIDKNTEKLRFE
jgi:L-asparaginase